MNCVYFVRHGQTVWNVENKICGATDSPLTEHGIEQARETARAILADPTIVVDEILYSPLSRARDTALIISEMTGIKATEEQALIEQNFGKWEGTPRDGADFLLAKREFVTRNEGGESMLQMAQRIYNLLDWVKEQNDKTYMLVAHNGIARIVNSYFNEMTNDEFAKYGIKNCQVVRFNFPE